MLHTKIQRLGALEFANSTHYPCWRFFGHCLATQEYAATFLSALLGLEPRAALPNFIETSRAVSPSDRKMQTNAKTYRSYTSR